MLIALVLGTFLWMAYRGAKETLVGAAGERAQAAASQIADLLDMQRGMAQLETLTADADLQRFVSTRDPDAGERVRARFSRFIGASARRIEVWDTGGSLLLDLTLPGTARQAGEEPTLPSGRAPSTAGISPIQGADGFVFSDLVVAIHARAASSSAQEAAADPTGYVRVRLTISETPPGTFSRLVGPDAVVRIANHTGGQWTDLTRMLPMPDLDLTHAGVAQYTASDGEQRIGAGSLVEGAPWTVWVDFPLAAVVAPANTFLARMSLIALVFVAVGGALATALAARITTPLVEISEAAGAVASGDYSRRVSVDRRDEIGHLGRTFNKMAADVESGLAALRKSEEAMKTLNAELEARVEARTRDLEEANRELEAFSYSVSHDLRAPLRHVQGYVEMLIAATEGQLAEKPRRYLKVITDGTVEMGELIDDLLAFSRVSRAQMSEGRVPLDAIVRTSVEALEMATRGRTIDWRIGALPEVLGDPALLKIVFANLIGNAVKYSRYRDPAVIEIGVGGEEDGRVILFVRDNGAGFDMRYAHKLFGVFQRLHRSEEFEGTGIGLATVRRIINRHGGRTWAEGKVDEGATIYLTLAPAAGLSS